MSTLIAPPPAPPRSNDGDNWSREPEPEQPRTRKVRINPFDYAGRDLVREDSAPVYRPGFGFVRG